MKSEPKILTGIRSPRGGDLGTRCVKDQSKSLDISGSSGAVSSRVAS